MLALNKKIAVYGTDGNLIKMTTLAEIHAEYVGGKLRRTYYDGNLQKCLEAIWLQEPEGLQFVVPERASGKTWQVGAQYGRFAC